jgi:hypothetical protein
MRKIYTLVMLSFVCMVANAQPDWLWAHNANGTIGSVMGFQYMNSNFGGNSVCTDVNGNVYVTGTFNSSVITFGTSALYNSRAYNMFLAKYDPSGNVLWAISSTGIGDNDYATSVCTDAKGNVYVTGWFDVTYCTFGTIKLNNPGMYIVKFDGSGNALWAKSAGGSSVFHNNAYGVAVDGNGNVFVTGTFADSTIVFDADTLRNAGMFIVKYDSSGNVLWAKNPIGGISNDHGYAVGTDGGGNVIVTGNYQSKTLTFGSYTITNPVNQSVFLVKYDALGNVLWAKSTAEVGGASDEVQSMCVDKYSRIFITGWFGNGMIFGSDTIIARGYENIFIASYDGLGNAQWAKSIGGNYYDYGYGVSTDGTGSVFVTGNCESDSVVFGSDTIGQGMFVAKYNASGNALWAEGAKGGTGYSVCNDANGNLYVQGVFSTDTTNFGSDTLINTNTGRNEMFIAKLGNVTGINELTSNSGSVCLYPNPNKGLFTIQSPAKLSKSSVEIYNVLGEKVCASKLNSSITQIDMSNNASGIYLYRIISQSGDFISAGKFIKE